MRRLSVFEPVLLGTESQWVAKALSDGHISGTSPIIAQFEKAFAQFVESSHCVAVANGTAAIHVALLALGIGPGDEVIVPDMTIISDAIGPILCGAKPVFVDVSPEDYCLDMKAVEKALTPRTKAILAVHMYGHGCHVDRLSEICREKGLFLVEDAAQAMGGKWKGRPLGSFGDAATYSFYPNKLITTGEGGAVTFRDAAIAKTAAGIRNLAFNPEPEKRFIHTHLSNNYRLSGLQAAMGLAQLEGVQKLLSLRQELRARYRRALSEIPHLSLPKVHSDCDPAFWMQTVVLDESAPLSVEALTRKLSEEGIETRRFFYPLHAQPSLSHYHDSTGGDFAVSKRLFERGLYLPSSPLLSEEDVTYVAQTLQNALK